MSSSAKIARLLLRSGAVVLRPEKPFRFASGILSPIYCDNRLLLSDVDARRDIVRGLTLLIQNQNPDQVSGTATAGIPWGAWVAEALAKPFSYVRGKAKDHGKGKQVEGAITKGGRTVVVEDLVSTGGSVISAVEVLREVGADVNGVAAIFSYGFADTTKEFQVKKISFSSLLEFPALLDVATEDGVVDRAQRLDLERWQKNPKGWSPTS